MATVSKPQAKPMGRAERDPQVYHPLDRLRGIIRRYVIIEGVLCTILFAALWFCLGLIFDYGFFKVTSFDWALDGSWWLRAFVLGLVVVGYFAYLFFRVFRRLTKEFSYPALALVLERRYPKLLGDRLITAVELADVDAMAKYGYSKEMIRATIAEARERVSRAPVNKVFNWARLWKLGIASVVLVIGTVGVSYAIYGMTAKTWSPTRFGWKFAHVSGIFLERNVALTNTPWPRQAHMELVGFPESGEMTVGRDAPPPRITARAYQWIIADRNERTGWRPLRWSDVNQDLVGRRVPSLPPGLTALEGDNPTVDVVERVAYENDEPTTPEVQKLRDKIKQEMNSDSSQDYEELQEVLKSLRKKADDPSMGRTLRRLDIPSDVTYRYYGKKTAGNGNLSPQQNNEFAGEIGGLKEDVDFVVKGADFSTLRQKIRLIPPPTLRRLGREQAEPAYLHHAPPQNDDYGALKGKLQKVSAKDLSLTGEATVFAVPAGTELTLIAEAFTDDSGNVSDNDRIAKATAKPISGKFPGMVYVDGKPTEQPVPLEIVNNGEAFRIEFKDKFRLMDNVKFEVTFINKYDILSRRLISIQVVQDQPPVVEVAVETIRRVGNVYLITSKARIPFNPDSFVKDDHGLSNVQYVFEYAAEDSDFVRAYRTTLGLRTLLEVPLPGTTRTAETALRYMKNFHEMDKSENQEKRSAGVSEFRNQWNRLRRDSRKVFDDLLPVTKVEDFPQQLNDPLAKAFPERQPTDRVLWVGDARNPKVFWLGDPRSPMAGRLTKPNDPQSAEKFPIANTNRDAMLAELREKEFTSAADFDHWYGELQTVKKVEMKDSGRDYFDLKELHDAGVIDLMPKGKEAVQSVFRMDLNIVATDSNVDNEGGPRVTKNIEPIRLKIVSEVDLLVEIGKEEQQLAERLTEAIARVTAARKKYEFVHSNNGFKPQVPENVDAVKVRAQDSLGDVEKSRDVVQSVAKEFQRLQRECEINRVAESTLSHYRDRATDFADVLSENLNVPGATYYKAQAPMNQVQDALNAGRWAQLTQVTDSETALYNLEQRLTAIRDRIISVVTKDGLKNDVKAMLERQERIRQDVQKWQKEIGDRLRLPYPTFGDPGALLLAKGETKTVSQTIQWNKYEDADDIVVKLEVLDANNKVVADAVSAPAEVKPDFNKNPYRFEYQLKGLKEGNYYLKMKPAVGPERAFPITVK